MVDTLVSHHAPHIPATNTAAECLAARATIRRMVPDLEVRDEIVAMLGLDGATGLRPARPFAIKYSKRGTRTDRRPEHRTATYAQGHRARSGLRQLLDWVGPQGQRAVILRVTGPSNWWADMLAEDHPAKREVIPL